MRRCVRATVLGATVLGATVLGAATLSTDVIGATNDAILAIRGRANTNASIAAAGDFVAVVWGAATASGTTDIYAAVSRDAGRTFAAPSRVNDVAGDARVSGEQPPRVSLVPHPGGDPSVVVVWTTKGPGGTQLKTARSDTGGRSFTRSTIVPGGDAQGNRGWESTAVDGEGHVAVLWLDHRETVSQSAAAAPMQHEGQHTHSDPSAQPDLVAKAQLSKLYFSRLDGSTPPAAVAGGVCYCCKTALAAGPDGSLYAAWRHVYPGNIRDIAFTVSRDGGRTFAAPSRVSEDKWVLDGCPEDGPAIAVDRQNIVHVVWPTLIDGPAPGAEPTIALFYATTRDGRWFTPRYRLPTEGQPHHPQIVIAANGAAVVVWDELRSGVRRAALARGSVDAVGQPQFARREAGEAASANHPVVAAAGAGIVLAWTSGPAETSQIRVRTLP
ncbi:MAG: hypothetical protein WBD07_04795 [Vicinamibacterales bacterium]